MLHGMISTFIQTVQLCLLPVAESAFGPLPPEHKRLVKIYELAEVDTFWIPPERARGRTREDRRRIARAFLAKAFFNLPTTRALLSRLDVDVPLRNICGWTAFEPLPSEATFSRAFAEFSLERAFCLIHEGLVSEFANDAEHILYISRDSTSIKCREKPLKKEKKEKKEGRGRPKGKGREPAPPPRLERQRQMRNLDEMLADLPTACDVGCKPNSKGDLEYWRGLKAHIDVAQGQIPVSVILTSASVHDSQVALPLMEMTDGRVERSFEIMDAAYDAWEIDESLRDRGIIPVIDRNPRASGVEKEKISVPQRSEAERVNGRLKDEFGGRNVRVRGFPKVLAHIMIGIVVLTADQLIRLAS